MSGGAVVMTLTRCSCGNDMRIEHTPHGDIGRCEHCDKPCPDRVRGIPCARCDALHRAKA